MYDFSEFATTALYNSTFKSYLKTRTKERSGDTRLVSNFKRKTSNRHHKKSMNSDKKNFYI